MANPADIAAVIAKLGIKGVDPSKVAAAMELVQSIGGDVQIDSESVEAYYPEVEESFYVPKAPKGFYTGDTKMLRRLNTPSASVFRSLLGIR